MHNKVSQQLESPKKIGVFYIWRVFATGLSFTLFGIGGPIISIGVGIALYFTPISTERRKTLARSTIKRSFQLYIRFMRACGLITYEITGSENIPTSGEIIVANHPTLLDVVFITSLIENANCIVKKALTNNIFTRPPISAAKFIRNDEPNFIESCVESLNQDSPLIIFPEGTRSVPGSPLKFQRGAANVAIAARANITPVLIQCSPPTLMKHQKWYNIPSTPPHFEIEFHPSIPIEQYLDTDAPQCKTSRKVTKDLTTWFSARLPESYKSN